MVQTMYYTSNLLVAASIHESFGYLNNGQHAIAKKQPISSPVPTQTSPIPRNRKRKSKEKEETQVKGRPHLSSKINFK